MIKSACNRAIVATLIGLAPLFANAADLSCNQQIATFRQVVAWRDGGHSMDFAKQTFMQAALKLHVSINSFVVVNAMIPAIYQNSNLTGDDVEKIVHENCTDSMAKMM